MAVTNEYLQRIAQRVYDDISAMYVNSSDVGIAEKTIDGTLITVVSEPAFFSNNIALIQVKDAEGNDIKSKTTSLSTSPTEKISITETIEITYKEAD